MRTLHINRSRPTIQLTLTYLAIIMAVSLVYSVVMYRVTAKQLVLQFRDIDGKHQTITGTSGDIGLPPGTPQPIANAAKGRATLRQNLIVLNIGVVVLGVPFCYFLARRTLRPIESAMENQARFSSDAAHELRTPVAALRVRNEVAMRDKNLSLQQAKQVIQSNADQAIRLEKLSEMLLQLSSQQGRPSNERTHLEDAANEAMNLHVLSAQTKHITIQDEVPNIVVKSARHDIVQVISILLDNAIKYSPKGTKITIRADCDQKWGMLHVIDHGPGIKPKDLPYIFDRFYRADTARTTSITSSYGLGLSIARKLVTQNKGVIDVHSTPDSGSKFTVKLPLAKL